MDARNQIRALTLLYVEDDADVLEELSDMLALKAGKLYTAKNGQEALDVMESNRIDLIITDIQMPVMDGLKLIEKVRERDEDIPIIVTTAFNEVEYLKRSIDLQVDQYITKPVDTEQLFAAIERTARTITQKKIIDDKDRLIRTLLDINPLYSIIEDAGSLHSLEDEIVSGLGLKNLPLTDGESAEWTTVRQVIDEVLTVRNTVPGSRNIWLKKEFGRDTSYIIKGCFFDNNDLVMLSFFDSGSIDQNGILEICYKCSHQYDPKQPKETES